MESSRQTGDAASEPSPAGLSRLDHLKLWAGAWAIRLVARVLWPTWRLRFACGADLLERLRHEGGPVILVYWHDGLFVLSRMVYRRLTRRGFRVTTFSSHSSDGELGAKLGKMWRARVVRGSTSRGAIRGLRALQRAATRDGRSPVMIPDGPCGPRRRAKPGTVLLARMCQLPIVPMAFASDRSWHLGSWDRMTIPKPFARVHLAIGEPHRVPRKLSADGVESECRRLETVLAQLEALASGGDQARE